MNVYWKNARHNFLSYRYKICFSIGDNVNLNFRWTLELPPDMEWGNLREDGNWTGIVAQLYNKVMKNIPPPPCFMEFYTQNI